MSDMPNAEVPSTDTQIDQAVAQGGAYDVLRRRLDEQGARLRAVTEGINTRRLQEFGDSRMEAIGRLRIRTEHNSVGRDIVQVGDLLLFGFNVYMGLKATTSVGDVFGLYRLVETGDGYDVAPVDIATSFLGDGAFQRDFGELYSYYKDARLLQLIVRDGRLLMAFQIGLKNTDVRVFRWTLTAGGEVNYLDARGERDIVLPPPFDFEWTRATKDMEVSGRHPHLNILDTLFVETIGGDLTLKVENNTESGAGVYSEPVEDRTQSLDDAQIEFARVGSLLLLKVLPYRESAWRGLVYNTQTGKVTRLDAIVQACIQLPEDHGIIFPGGYYLQNGEHKAFDAAVQDMQYKRTIRSPNGEDVMYVFYERETGQAALLVYNLVQRRLQPPVLAHGYARLHDGRMVLFRAENDDPTRIHQMQLWQTPFSSDEFAATRPAGTSFMARLGNAELVRAVSNLFDLAREIERPDVSAQRYQLLTHGTRRLFDLHHWIDDAQCDGLATLLHEIAGTGESVLDEYEKVQEIRRQSETSMAQAQRDHRALLGRLQPEGWNGVGEFVDALGAISRLRGHLLTLRDYRYIDIPAIDAMVATLQEAHERVGTATGQFLAGEKALAPFQQRLGTLDAQAQKATSARELAEAIEAMQGMAGELDMLSELMATLKVDDATQRTRVVDALSAIYARLNQVRARTTQRRRELGSAEAVAQFGAQFTLFGQAVSNALAMATTPERADEQLSRLMVQLEELESQFGEHEQFLGDILSKREEMLEAFEAHKQALLDERQRKAQSVQEAANRILEGLGRRTERFTTPDELNAFFAGDALILKLRELAGRLRELKDSVKADDIEARIKGARDQAVRGLRDRSDLFEDAGNVIRLGPRHRFSVNTQPLDLTLIPRGDTLAVHLTGTDYLEPLQEPALDALRPYWDVALASESPSLYRGEYLACRLLDDAQAGEGGLDLARLDHALADPEALDRIVREYAAPRYREGYEKGIHDHDAAAILRAFLPLRNAAGALRHAPTARALAVAWWCRDDAAPQETIDRIRAARAIDAISPAGRAVQTLRDELASTIVAWVEHDALSFPATDAAAAAVFLIDTVTGAAPTFRFTHYADALVTTFRARLADDAAGSVLASALQRLEGRPAAAWALLRQALDALATLPEQAHLAPYVPEAIALFRHGAQLTHVVEHVTLIGHVEGLLGEHPRIREGRLALAVDDLPARFAAHRDHFVPAWQRYQALRSEVAQRERAAMRLSEFKARPLTSFVRNKLINDVYLPVIGDNLAKQMGTVGENKRSDLMGLLMMISPPGYGKTTLMEYVGHRLGLVFMKINGPALGHEVRSLDPAQAPDATSRQELEKLNLALEMGNNVMLYLDDIQHTHPEFLQKFISLCDGTRRIEGVWRGKTKTYDMRGRKFAVVMAGNPYTESGEVFKIPDMLANRADIYNLGDVLGGMEDAFLLSYVENCLTSNPVLAPLATRDMADLYLLVDKARGKEVSTNQLSHAYSGAEIGEIVAVLQRLLTVRDVVYCVNQQYIASAAQADKYRVEPPFRLQGSYRNMNKLAEKISPVMNATELQQLIADHYLGEAQLLTTGAEENLLKLGELRGTLTDDEQARWQQIKADFLRNKAMGADDADVGGRVVAQLADIAVGLQRLGEPAPVQAPQPAPWEALLSALHSLRMPQPVAAAPPTPGVDTAPVLQALQHTMARQDQLNGALVALAQALRNGVSPAAAAGTRKPKPRSPREAEFDQVIASLEFREERPTPTLDVSPARVRDDGNDAQ
ncbi:dynein-related subfamily AAA family protein [Pseudoxanthomonas sp. 3HH-4]|uniref:DNA repair ATPase n=1 Tax=Pseudoxanthomonas sp. 3HH-4 TaxID=1690214 RepID=UPI00115422DD|nr:DNA repair ATPase [Pseudoxanthomonas sp. 3HH-4]TQM05773.1 dynein-related subfamily AAA family protein [Pseudoxanthomonas sp. 3HH-4]